MPLNLFQFVAILQDFTHGHKYYIQFGLTIFRRMENELEEEREREALRLAEREAEREYRKRKQSEEREAKKKLEIAQRGQAEPEKEVLRTIRELLYNIFYCIARNYSLIRTSKFSVTSFLVASSTNLPITLPIFSTSVLVKNWQIKNSPVCTVNKENLLPTRGRLYKTFNHFFNHCFVVRQ